MSRYRRRMHIVPRTLEFILKLIGTNHVQGWHDRSCTLPLTNQKFEYDTYYVLEQM